MEMPLDNNSETAPKNLQESEQTTRSSLWVLPETLRLGATIGLWPLAAVGLVLNLSALVCYFRTRRLTFTFQLPYITVGVNLFVNNLLLVVAILLAAVTLTFGHREVSIISDGAQAFLTIHVLLQSWVSHVLSIFYAASTVHARPQKASETTKENVDDIPDAMKDQADRRCNKLLSCLQVRLWRKQASEGCRRNGEGDAPNISNEPQSRSCSPGSAGPSKYNTAWSLRWWLLWTWILSLLSGTALLLCSTVDDTRLSRTFNPFRRWYLVPQSGGTATQQGGADTNVCSPRIPVLLAVLCVYVAGSLIITASVLRLHTICRLGHRLPAASFSATRGPHAEWQHKTTPRFKQLGKQDAQSADASKNEPHFRSRGQRDISSSSFSSDWEEPEWDVVSEEQESSCDVTTAGGVSTARSLSSDDSGKADGRKQAYAVSTSLEPSRGVCQERRGFTRNKSANGVQENSQEEGDKVSVNFTVGCDDDDRENRMYDVTKQRPPLEKNVSSSWETSPDETMNHRTSQGGEKNTLKLSFQNADRSADAADASWKGREQPGLQTDGRKETADVEQEVDEHEAKSSETSTGGDASPVLCNSATAGGVDKGLNEASMQNVNHNARNSPRARSWSAERSQHHSNVHLNRRRHGSSRCEKSTIRMKGQRSNSCPDVASQLQGQISKRGLGSSRNVHGQVSDSGQDPAAGSVGQMSERCLGAFSNIQITRCPQVFVEASGQVSDNSEDATPHVNNQISSNVRSPRQVFIKKTKASKRCYADNLELGESKAVGRVSAKRAFLVNSESDEDMCCSYCSEETAVREDKCGFHSTEDCQPSKAPASRTGGSRGQQVLTPRKRSELLLKERHLTHLYRENCERKRKKRRFASTKKCAGVLADPLVLAQAMDLLGLGKKGRVQSFDDNVNASSKRKSQRTGVSGGDMTDPSSFLAEDPSDDDLDRTSPSSSDDPGMLGDEFAMWQTSRHAIHRASQEYDKTASALDIEKSTRESRIIAKGTRDRTTSRGSRLMRAAPSSMRPFTAQGAPTSGSQMAPTSWQLELQLSPPQLGSQTPAVWSRDSPRTYRRQIYERGQRYQFPEELRTRAEMLDLEAGGTQGDLGDVVSSWMPGRSAGAAGTGFQEGTTLFPNVHSGSAEWRHAAYARKWDRDTEGDVLMNHAKRSHDADLSDSVATGSNSFLWSGYPPPDPSSLQSHILPTQQDRLRMLQAGRSSPAGQDACVDQLLMPFVEAPLPASAAAGYFYVPAYVSRRTSQAEIGRQKSWVLVRKKTDNIANRAENAFREDATDTSNSDLDLPADSGNTNVRSSWRRRAMQRFFKKLRNWNARRRAQGGCCVHRRRSEKDVTVWEGGDATGALSWVVLHAVTCIPFAVSLVPGVLDRASPEGRIVALMAVQFLLFSHVVACPLWLLWQHGFIGSRT